MSETPKLPPISELRALAEKATPTDAAVLYRYDHGSGRVLIEDIPGRKLIADFYHEGDREFYATARATVLALLSRMEELEGALRRAPVPVPSRFELELYTDWYFIVRGAALRGGSDG